MLNPVRAGIAAKAEDWSWSSYGATIGIRSRPAWLTVDWILSQFGRDKKNAVSALKEYVESGAGEKYPIGARPAGLILGNEEFLEKIQGLVEAKMDLIEIPRPQRTIPRPELKEIFQEGSGKDRDHYIHQAYVKHGYTMKEIAAHLQKHYVSVSRAIKRYERKTNM